jgi:hypothetical protein
VAGRIAREADAVKIAQRFSAGIERKIKNKSALVDD